MISVDARLARRLRSDVEDAARRGEPMTTVHLVWCLLRSGAVRAAVASTGASAEAVKRAAHRALEAGVAEAVEDARAVEGVMTRAATRVAGSGGVVVEATDVLITLAETTDCAGAALLAAHGVAPLALKLYVSHRPPPDRARGLARLLGRWLWPQHLSVPSFDPDQPVVVVIHNDSFTTKQFVVHVLEHHFATTHDEALALMAQVHHGGRGRVGKLPHDEAVRRIDAVTRLARAQGFPLRLSVEGVRPTLPRAQLRRR